MDRERKRQTFLLLQRALDLPEGERAAFLEQECGDDIELRHTVERLIAQSLDMPAEFLAPPTEGGDTDFPSQLGDFRLEREIGRGAMGIVWRAEQVSLDRPAAVKVLSAGLLSTASQIERFHREARAAALLDHPGIVRVLADGHEAKLHWFAMEWVEGHDLEREIELLRSLATHGELDEPSAQRPFLPPRGDPQHIARIATLIAEIADALEHAHVHGIVHRDVKPSNLLLDGSGRVKITDFGIARDERFGSLTQTDQLIGSLPYMSPEQAHVVEAAVDGRTDVYSLGVVLYELLSLRRPYEGRTSHEILLKIRTHRPLPVRRLNPTVPRDLALICEQAMRTDPRRRYQSAGELAADLRRFLALESVRATPLPLSQRTMDGLRRHRTTVVAGTVGVLALLGGGFVTKGVVEARAWDRRLEPLRAWHGDANWSERSVTELMELDGELSTLLGNEGKAATDPTDTHLDEDEFAVLTELRTRLREETVRRAEAARRLLDEGLTAMLSDSPSGQEPLLQGFRELHQIELLDPDVDADRLYLPRVSIRFTDGSGTELDGEVSVCTLDPITAEVVDISPLGSLPLDNASLPPAALRIRVTGVDLGIREFHRVPKLGESIEIHQTVRPLVTDDMVAFSGGVLQLADPAPNLSPLQGRSVDVGPFRIDPYEVSIGDYREFLDANPDAERPDYLDSVPRGSELERRPVVMISWHGARAYAEWRGKRLPTHAEWMWAARGAEARVTPWGATDPTQLSATGEPIGNVHRQEDWSFRPAERWEWFVRLSRDVNSDPAARTPELVFHMFGNVAEWTESVLASEDEHGTLRSFSSRRVVAGHAWDAVKKGLDLRYIEQRGIGRRYAAIHLGFRCATTMIP